MVFFERLINLSDFNDIKCDTLSYTVSKDLYFLACPNIPNDIATDYMGEQPVHEYILGFIRFIPLDANAPKFFGFSEFLASLALMVLAWTIADVRYRFRVMTSPLPLQKITFAIITAVGILTLLTDLWRAEQWLVPAGNLLTPASWQAILGGAFLFTFLSWAWFAFIKPPIYNKRNAVRYAQILYRLILKGDPKELSVIADEVTYSVKPLVRYATDRRGLNKHRLNKEKNQKSIKPLKATARANDILLLIADKRFCRAIVESSPGTALAIFREILDTKKYGIQIETFSKNIVTEALTNKNSFLYHEAEGYKSGFIGYHKPLSQAMFSNYKMVEAIGTLLDTDIWDKRKWDTDQWKAYCRIVLLTFHDYVENAFGNHSPVLYRAKGYIENAVMDLYKINGLSNTAWDDDNLQRLRVVVGFIKDAVGILEKGGAHKHIKLRIREECSPSETFYDYIASLILEIIFAASTVYTPFELCWWVQHTSVWREFFNFNRLDGPAGKIVKFKVRRLIYNEIAEMKHFPNFKGAKILGFCLNVMGFKVKEEDYDLDSKALQKTVLSWTKKNYAWLHTYNPRIAEACLVDSITYDPTSLKLVKTYPAEGLRRKAEHIFFPVDLPSEAT